MCVRKYLYSFDLCCVHFGPGTAGPVCVFTVMKPYFWMKNTYLNTYEYAWKADGILIGKRAGKQEL
jgi:hypothetical protein